MACKNCGIGAVPIDLFTDLCWECATQQKKALRRALKEVDWKELPAPTKAQLKDTVEVLTKKAVRDASRSGGMAIACNGRDLIIAMSARKETDGLMELVRCRMTHGCFINPPEGAKKFRGKTEFTPPPGKP